MLSTYKRLIPQFLALAVCIYLSFINPNLLGSFSDSYNYMAKVGVWLFGAFTFNVLIDIFIWDKLVGKAMGRKVPGLLRHTVFIVILIITLMGIIGQVFNKPLTGIWATSGVLGLILGFALRSLILDAFVGLAINIDHPYKIGDFVFLHHENIDGQVVDISWRTTRIETSTNNTIIIPNSTMGLMVITNYSRPSAETRFSEVFTFSSSVPIKQVKRVLLAGAKAVQAKTGFLEDHEPRVLINGTNSAGIEYKVRYWIDASAISPSKARDAIYENILTGLQQAGISLANPTQEVLFGKLKSKNLSNKSIKDRISLLNRVDLFESLENEELETLASDINLKLFIQGETVFNEGETGDSMFILTEGLLNVYKVNEKTKKETRVNQVHPGEFLGEMSFLTGEPRSATIKASTDAVTYEIKKAHLLKLLDLRPEIAEAISKVAAKRSMQNLKTMENATPEEKEEQSKSLAKQILNKMKSIFKRN